MSQKFDELKSKIENVDTSQATEVLQQVKQAKEDGNISEEEKQTLMNAVKEKAGDIDFGKFSL